MPAFPATDNGDGSYAATWTPPEGGKYQIDVQVAVAGALPVAIAGAPFVATVVAADEFFGNAEVTNSWASLDSAFVDAIRKEIAQNVVWVDGCIAALEGKDPSAGGIDDSEEVDMASQLLTIQKAIAEVNSGAEDAGKALALSAKHIAFVALETAVRARSCSVFCCALLLRFSPLPSLLCRLRRISLTTGRLPGPNRAGGHPAR